jgi:hypothetical protein
MPLSNYEIYVNTTPFEDNPHKAPDDETRFQVHLNSVEIIPPTPSELDDTVCVAILNKLAEDMGLDGQRLLDEGVNISPDEFCYRGEKVSTFISITGRPGKEVGFGGSKENIENDKLGLSRAIQQVLPPLGNAVATSGSEKYEVYASITDAARETDVTNMREYTHVEIAPPVSKALAGLVCDKIKKHVEGLDDPDRQTPAGTETELEAYGFCDEGALISTLIRFKTSRRFPGDQDTVQSRILMLERTAQLCISPSLKLVDTNRSNIHVS